MLYPDIYYFILVIPALIISMWAQYKVKSNFNKFSSVLNSRGITGAAAAQAILSYYNIADVSVRQIAGSLTDNFNPQTNVISLSQSVYGSSSIAAIGVACHEAGHAAQHAEGYTPIKIRNTIIPICKIGSAAGLPLAVLGLILSFGPLVYLGLGLYATVFVLQLVTLPVEFDASKRALKVIEETGLLYNEEIDGARKVLQSAALTYVASMLVSLANLLRFILRFTRNSRR